MLPHFYMISICVLIPLITITSYVLAITVHSSKIVSMRKDNYIVQSKCIAAFLLALFVLPIKLYVAFKPEIVTETICLLTGLLPEYLSIVFVSLHFAFVFKKSLEFSQNKGQNMAIAITAIAWILPALAFSPMVGRLYFQDHDLNGTTVNREEMERRSLCLSYDWIMGAPFRIPSLVCAGVSSIGASMGYIICILQIRKATNKITTNVYNSSLGRLMKTTRSVCIGFGTTFLATALVFTLKGIATTMYITSTSPEDNQFALKFVLLAFVFQWFLPIVFMAMMFYLFAELRSTFVSVFIQCSTCYGNAAESVPIYHLALSAPVQNAVPQF